jgi:hypothetical protein
MALKKNFVLQFHDQSIVLPDAYCKVLRLLGTKDELIFDVDIKDTQDGKSYRVLSHKFAPNLNGANFIAQAYEHLKTLPEFSGAIDC